MIVVGAGVVGLAAAFELSRAGDRVTVVSADLPGSRQSAGRSRIFRLSHADGSLTEAAARSLELWEMWEAIAGHTLLERVGLLLTGDMSDREVHLRRYGGLEHLSGVGHPLGIAHEQACLESTGAAIHAEDTVRFLQRECSLVLGEALSLDSGGVTLIGGERMDAERVVVSAGPDTYRLLGVPEPARMRSVRFSFALREPLEAPAPCWIQRDERLCEPFYAVIDGAEHYSVGLSAAAPAALPEAEHVRDAHERILDIVRRVSPGLQPICARLRTSVRQPGRAHTCKTARVPYGAGSISPRRGRPRLCSRPVSSASVFRLRRCA